MPCLKHEHKPWPSNGEHLLRIEACETHCGWCAYKTKAANNLRVHARRHAQNPRDSSLKDIEIIFGKAGRNRVALRSDPSSTQQHEAENETVTPEIPAHSPKTDNAHLGTVSNRARVDKSDVHLESDATSSYEDATMVATVDHHSQCNTDRSSPNDPINFSHEIPRYIHMLKTAVHAFESKLCSFQENSSVEFSSIDSHRLETLMEWSVKFSAGLSSFISEQRLREGVMRTSLGETTTAPPNATLAVENKSGSGPETVPSASGEPVSGKQTLSPNSIHYTRTGRISKAKKGLKVYNCECGRSYTRAEHLRSHQKNHAQDPLVCDYLGCGKMFFRVDLLLRHQERHNDPAPALPAPPPAPPPADVLSHESSSSFWLDLTEPTDFLDFFSEPSTDLLNFFTEPQDVSPAERWPSTGMPETTSQEHYQLSAPSQEDNASVDRNESWGYAAQTSTLKQTHDGPQLPSLSSMITAGDPFASVQQAPNHTTKDVTMPESVASPLPHTSEELGRDATSAIPTHLWKPNPLSPYSARWGRENDRHISPMSPSNPQPSLPSVPLPALTVDPHTQKELDLIYNRLEISQTGRGQYIITNRKAVPRTYHT